jgi:hypothetical protein
MSDERLDALEQKVGALLESDQSAHRCLSDLVIRFETFLKGSRGLERRVEELERLIEEDHFNKGEVRGLLAAGLHPPSAGLYHSSAPANAESDRPKGDEKPAGGECPCGEPTCACNSDGCRCHRKYAQLEFRPEKPAGGVREHLVDGGWSECNNGTACDWPHRVVYYVPPSGREERLICPMCKGDWFKGYMGECCSYTGKPEVFAPPSARKEEKK